MSQPTVIKVNEYGTPRTKLPDCPQCDEDELSLIGSTLFCNRCNRREIVETVRDTEHG